MALETARRMPVPGACSVSAASAPRRSASSSGANQSALELLPARARHAGIAAPQRLAQAVAGRRAAGVAVRAAAGGFAGSAPPVRGSALRRQAGAGGEARGERMRAPDRTVRRIARDSGRRPAPQNQTLLTGSSPRASRASLHGWPCSSICASLTIAAPARAVLALRAGGRSMRRPATSRGRRASRMRGSSRDAHVPALRHGRDELEPVLGEVARSSAAISAAASSGVDLEAASRRRAAAGRARP